MQANQVAVRKYIVAVLLLKFFFHFEVKYWDISRVIFSQITNWTSYIWIKHN